MKIILAQPRGFCAGVVRAIETVERALEKYGAPVYVRHEIVHNRHVVESLKSQGRALRRGIERGAVGRRDDLQRARRIPQGRGRGEIEGAPDRSTRPVRWSPRCITRDGAMSLRGGCWSSSATQAIPKSRARWVRSMANCISSQSMEDVEKLPIAPRRPDRLCDPNDAQRRRHARRHRRAATAGSATSWGPILVISATRPRIDRRRCENCPGSATSLSWSARQQLQLEPAARDRRRGGLAELSRRRRRRHRGGMGQERPRRRRHRGRLGAGDSGRRRGSGFDADRTRPRCRTSTD